MTGPHAAAIVGGVVSAILAIIGGFLVWARAERNAIPTPEPEAPTFEEHAAKACAHTTGGVYVPPTVKDICDAMEWQFQNTDTPGGPQ